MHWLFLSESNIIDLFYFNIKTIKCEILSMNSYRGQTQEAFLLQWCDGEERGMKLNGRKPVPTPAHCAAART